MRIKSFTANPEDVARYGPLEDESGERRLSLRLVGSAKGVVIARLAGIADRDRAEALRGLRLYLPRAALPPAGQEEYYHADLIGLEAALADGTALGHVRAVHDFGAGDTLEIERPARPAGHGPVHPRDRADCRPRRRPAGARSAARADRRPGAPAPVQGPPPRGRAGAGRMSWRATVLTIFPEMLPGPLAYSLAGKALEAGIWQLETVDIRDFARDKHRSVDDAPFGGGPGMVMRPDVLDAAIAGAGGVGPLILLSPRGRPLDQERVRALAAMPGVRLICGRFEGVDERVLEARSVEEVSLGDFVLSGGEPAAIALIDACVRLLPGVVGCAETLAEESFAEGLLEYPHYTRPQLWQGRAVPDVLVSGDHQRVRAWRRAEAERLTRERRPDLWRRHVAKREAARQEEER